ncbi:hypothetical protein [Amycolatopsis regifaucium]|uniref:hypothetical protein n=1 Tax=Amycolatopsis regifaucium TaxID=546365 RepID=UPI0008F62B2C|nr:hypothetical protein [Amycolatopsis regifaucium]SFI90780.1 hypothetical protein SAMN04489731_11414 [Amycolatopsis regifaucium]
MNDEAPSWDALRRRLTRAPYSPEGIAAVGLAIDKAERMLGPSWPGRQFERKGWWPSEFNLLMFHAPALPQFLAFVMRLESATKEPTFTTVLRSLKRGVKSTDWRHALLQLEVHRALRSAGTAITFEPEISGSRNKADLMITPTEGGAPFLVKTTSLARADVDQAWEEYEHRLWHAVTALELRHNVRIAVELIDHRDHERSATPSAVGAHRSPPPQRRQTICAVPDVGSEHATRRPPPRSTRAHRPHRPTRSVAASTRGPALGHLPPQ